MQTIRNWLVNYTHKKELILRLTLFSFSVYLSFFSQLAYSKSIALLYDQTKLILNEPFYTTDECNNLNWPNDIKSIDEDEIWDNQDIRSILR